MKITAKIKHASDNKKLSPNSLSLHFIYMYMRIAAIIVKAIQKPKNHKGFIVVPFILELVYQTPY